MPPQTNPAESPAPRQGPPAPSTEHYFTAEPVSPEKLRIRDVELAGRPVQVLTAGGIFSPDSLDRGTTVLLSAVPDPPLAGTFLDLGCGWGPVALTMALKAPGATVHAVDVNRRALDVTRRNVDALVPPGSAGSRTRVHVSEPADVPADVHFDLIWSNPAVRIGKSALHEMLLHWLPRLTPGGSAYLVVSKSQGADSLQAWLADHDPHWNVGRHASAKGFRVIQVHRPPDTPPD